MASIRASGGKGGGGLRKVNDAEKKDRSGAFVPGAASEPSGGASGGGGGGGAPQGGLAGALQDALAKRKQKVSGSGMYDFFLWVKPVLIRFQMTKKTTTTNGERLILTTERTIQIPRTFAKFCYVPRWE